MLKRFSALVVALWVFTGFLVPVNADVGLPETSIQYRIDVELTPETRRLKGWEEIVWTNRSETAVDRIPMHLYLNGFSHEGTTWMREGALNRFPLKRLIHAWPEVWGYSEPTLIAQHIDGEQVPITWAAIQPDDHNLFDRSMIELTLAQAVAPGNTVKLRVEFEARLPIPIARTGGRDDYFLVAQWFPKISALETRGTRHAPKTRWAGHQFHGPTEFFADFADFDVTLTIASDDPDAWLVAATGERQDDPNTIRYVQRAVHDFAFMAGRGFEEASEIYTPQGGGPPVSIRYIFPSGTQGSLAQWRKAIRGALDVFGSRVGPYPYATLTAVMPPIWGARTSGMEYPTFITGMLADPAFELYPASETHLQELVLIHEFGHQYFYGLLASHEQEEALLDEGFNSYWEYVVLSSLYGEQREVGSIFGHPVGWTEMRQYRSGLAQGKDPYEPLRKRPSWLFYPGSWGNQIYGRPALMLLTASRLFGAKSVDAVFAEYYRRWAFKHPDMDDFLEVARDVGGPAMGDFLREAVEQTGGVDFKVDALGASQWQPPLGRIVIESGPITITPDNRAKYPHVGLADSAWEREGHLSMEIIDPGWVRVGGASKDGRTLHQTFPTAPQSKTPEVFFASHARVRGPGWDNLPVDVEFRFADGVAVTDRWDGRALWRQYRFLRPAPLTHVILDPAGKVAMDDRPDNNARTVKADRVAVSDWSLWFGAMVQWAAGLALWL